MKKLNRFQMQQHLEGFKAELTRLEAEYTAKIADVNSTAQERQNIKASIEDVKDRFSAMKAELEALDAEEAKKLKAKEDNNLNAGITEQDKILKAKAGLIRDVMANKPVSAEFKAVLGDNTSTGGSNFLPKTVANELVTPAFGKNPLRGLSTFTQTTNLEVPRVLFTLSDDEFINDGETAKELAVSGEMIQFGRYKFKVFCDISETVLNGTETNLVVTVENALKSGLATKEKKIAFATAPKEEMKHCSFYGAGIKEIEKASLFDAITEAYADLEDEYAGPATIVMRKVDYYKIIKELSNGSNSLYAAPPEAVLGTQVEFCDLAVKPVIGDFTYSHFNYDLNMLYEHDKNIKTGIDSFVVTAWIDHQIKLKSAFRIASVQAGE